MRKRRTASLAFAGVSMFALAATLPVVAAEVTPERLINANKEPHNWLMNHRTYDAQRFSPLDAINEGNVKGLRLAYAVALGNSAGKEYNEATALAEDGFLYITDSWGVLYKIDVTSGQFGRGLALRTYFLSVIQGRVSALSITVISSCKMFGFALSR